MLKWAFLAVFSPGMLLAQMMPMGDVCLHDRPVRDLNLSEAQQTQISAICKDSAKLFELRKAWKKAEAELQAAFDESPVDQAKSNNAIEHLGAARSDMFRATSQMELKIRTVLTAEQWQQLKIRQRRGPGRPGGPGGPDGPGWRRGGPSSKGNTLTTQPQK